MNQVRKRCVDQSYNHKFLAFVDEDRNVSEICSLCDTTYFYSSSENNAEVSKE